MSCQRPNQFSGKIPAVRCAIYTRKSTQDGLEQEFNSLDAQRESAEAYIASQKSEGWGCLGDKHDDGGFTPEHPVLLKRNEEIGFASAEFVQVGDSLVRQDLSEELVETVERSSERVTTVAVHVPGPHRSTGRRDHAFGWSPCRIPVFGPGLRQHETCATILRRTRG